MRCLAKSWRNALTETTLSSLAAYLALASFAVATLALVLSIRSHRRKTGLDIRCDYAIASSISSAEQWVSEVRLENAKDRSVSIYKIYLEVGHGIFIQVEDFNESPLSLDAYSVYQGKYDPIEFYYFGMKRVTGFLNDRKARQRIMLTTSQGRHYPKRGTKTFDDPFLDTLKKNYATGVLHPMRWLHEGRCYGSEARFIVTLTYADGKDDVVPIYPRDYEVKKFRNFALTRRAIESKRALQDFLQEQVTSGELSCFNIDVIDLEVFKHEAFEDYSETVTVTPRGWFSHKVMGRCWTLWQKLILKRKNRKVRSRRN